MADKILAKDKLGDFLGKLQADYEVYAPQEITGTRPSGLRWRRARTS